MVHLLTTSCLAAVPEGVAGPPSLGLGGLWAVGAVVVVAARPFLFLAVAKAAGPAPFLSLLPSEEVAAL